MSLSFFLDKRYVLITLAAFNILAILHRRSPDFNLTLIMIIGVPF